MSNQLQITGGAKVRNLEGAIVGSSGVLSSVGLGVANGVATLGTDGKVPSSQLPTLASSYKGTWNAATNTPTIADGVGTAGDYYLVSTGGVWNGITFTEGQTVIYSGTIWQRAGGASGVTSVALTAPAAFAVSGSPIVSTGTLAITAAGTTAQYISGAGTLVSFPTNLVTTARTVNTTSPLQGGGALSSDLTLTIQQATTTQNGYLSSTDFNTFAGKEGTLTFYSPLFRSGNSVFITQATTSASGYLTSANWNNFNDKQSALSGTGIVKSTAGVISYLTDNTANWDSAYNNTIVSASVTGTTTKTLTLTQQDAGTITASWTDLNTNAVSSVFGRIGAVVSASGDYNTGQVTETGNLYYTNARARASISLTTTGNNGSSSYDNINGVLNVPTYTLAGLGGQTQLNGTGFVRAAGTTITYDNTSYTPTSRTLTINGVAQDLSANRNWDILTMVYPGAGIAVSTGTAWGTSITDNSSNWNAAYAARIASVSAPLVFSSNALSITQSSGSTSGYLSSTDWSIFNNKLNGSGLTAGKVPFATGSNSLGDSALNYNGGNFGFGTAASTYRIDAVGNINVTGNYYINGVAIATGSYLPLSGGTLSGPLAINAGGGAALSIVGGGDIVIASAISGANVNLYNDTGELNVSTPLIVNGSVSGTIGNFATSLSTPDIRNTGTGYITYDTNATGTSSLILRSGYAGSVLYFDGVGAAIFSSSVTATSFFESSDKTIKTLIEDNYIVDGISDITPKLYTKNGKTELGYFAQDLVGVLDCAVATNDSGLLSLSYREVHTAKIYALEQRIKELENKFK